MSLQIMDAAAAAIAHVYALVGPDGHRCYVGSKTESIRCRLIRHKSRAVTGERPHSVLHNAMAQNGPENYTVEHLATVPLDERFRTEAQYIRSHGILNMVIPGRTRAERRAEARAARVALLG